jgi:hypothetical protein
MHDTLHGSSNSEPHNCLRWLAQDRVPGFWLASILLFIFDFWQPVDPECADLENLSERIDELNGTVRVRKLPFQFTLDLYGRSKLAANYIHMLKTGVVAQQLSDSSFKGGQCLFNLPTLAH